MQSADQRIAGTVETHAADELLWLLPEHAAYWPRLQTLIVADVHLGKAAAFRRAGVPVPSGTTADNLERLTSLVERLNAQRVIFLGDLVHDAAAQAAATGAFTRWRAQHRAVEMLLVRDNHDRRAGDFAAQWNIVCSEEPYLTDSLALVHAPRAVTGHYAIGGHIHPAAQLAGRGRELVRLPCFHFTPDYAVLPAFGAFTGMADVAPTPGDRVYVVADKQVLALKINSGSSPE